MHPYVGQLIVFETLAALAYAYLLRGSWPEPLVLTGILLLLLGVFLAVRIKPQKAPERSSP
jgi:drug/metabolite transporter (DMT)-like permease